MRAGLLACCAALVLVSRSWGAESSKQTAQSLVQAAYQKTKTATTAEELTEVLELCRRAQAARPTGKLPGYIQELLSWTHNRRGESYAEAAAARLSAGDKDGARKLDAKALADFEQAVEHNPARAKPFHNRGVSYALLGKYPQAIADFTRALQLDPKYANARFNLGEIYLEMGQFEQAAGHYSAALELEPDDAHAICGRGHARVGLGRLPEALQDFERALKLDPKSAKALTGRGDAYQRMGKWQEAASDLREAVRLDPKSPQAYQGAAWLMATCPDDQVRKVELAVQAAERAMQLSGGEDYRCLDALAAAYANADRFDDAVRTIRQAIAKAPDQPVRSLLDARLKLYESKKPFRQTVPATVATRPESP